MISLVIMAVAQELGMNEQNAPLTAQNRSDKFFYSQVAEVWVKQMNR